MATMLAPDAPRRTPTPSRHGHAAPKCAAAKGLAGDNLLCVDFRMCRCCPASGVGLYNKLWNPLDYHGRQAPGQQLLHIHVDLHLPDAPCPAADYAKYSSFTLSVVHRVDVNDQQQRVQIMLGADDQSNRLLDWMTGKAAAEAVDAERPKTDLPCRHGRLQPCLRSRRLPWSAR